MSQVSFKASTQTAYDSQSVKEENVLYFTTDTNRIYKGSSLYASNVLRVVDSLPNVGVDSTFYWLSSTEKLYLYDGSFNEINTTIDLSDYSTTTQVQSMINAAIAGIVDANSTEY